MFIQASGRCLGSSASTRCGWSSGGSQRVVQPRITADYLDERQGRIDLGVVVATFPYYLIPGISGRSAILLIARFGRVARVLLATARLRRLSHRLVAEQERGFGPNEDVAGPATVTAAPLRP